jgi:pectate lyase
MCEIASLSALSLSAQDKPDGFASISGRGINTTTGGEGGQTVNVYSLSALRSYAGSSKPYIILVHGKIQSSAYTELTVTSNKTIVGVGDSATLVNIELHLIKVKNVIIRNLTVRDVGWIEMSDGDGIQVDNSHHLWIDHCHFSHCYDGLIDLRKVCDYVTISWTKLSNHNKAFGIGWTDSTNFFTTIHHCWFDSCQRRNPSFDQGIGHLYNNYLSNITAYGNRARGNARVIVENSVFENSTSPFSIDDPAKLYSSGNQFINCKYNQSGNVSIAPYDIKAYYDYMLDSTSEVKAKVKTGAGPHSYISDQYASTTLLEHTPKEGRLISYYYNPAQKILFIQASASKKLYIKILSLDGRILLSKNINQTASIEVPLNGFRSGMYSICFDVNGTIKTGHIILQ